MSVASAFPGGFAVGLNAIDEAIGRSTEMGRPVLMVPGLSGLGPVGIQAVNVFAYVTRTAAKFATPIQMGPSDAALDSVAQEIILRGRVRAWRARRPSRYP